MSKIFENKNYQPEQKVLSLNDFKLFINQKRDFQITEENKAEIISEAEGLIGKQYPVLPANEYMMYQRDGNRKIFEDKYFERRNDLLLLATAEYAERKGRFTDSIIDLLWMIMEESTWVVPAHNRSLVNATDPLPRVWQGERDYIDLFAASTGATLAAVYYLCRDILDKETPILCERLLSELDMRIVSPFLSKLSGATIQWWTGERGRPVNNWCPWIVSNVLTVCALAVENMRKREAIVTSALPMLDRFINGYKSDGGCDEGPSYWGVAGGALFEACSLLYDLTNGYIDISDETLYRRIGEYAALAYITENRSANFADCPADVIPDALLVYHFGISADSEIMKNYGQALLAQRLADQAKKDIPHKMKSKSVSSIPYRYLRNLSTVTPAPTPLALPQKTWFDGIMLAITRENQTCGDGLYLAFKGGHNAESHNHNDVGSIIVFSDNKPIFLDAGCGTYTKRTFSNERYTIWSMTSDGHNLPSFNGVSQKPIWQARASDPIYCEDSGKLTLNLTNAYPAEAGLKEYRRSAVLENGAVTVTDTVEFLQDGEVAFHYICNQKPTDVTQNSFMLHGRTVHFDDTLTYSVEAMDCSMEETMDIPKKWNTDTLWRITLKTNTPIKEKTFVLTVN
jgi:hypothetical protein